jgi:hypothetical protein
VFENVRRDFNEFRWGGEVTVAKFHLTVLRRWELYKDDSPESLTTAESSNDPATGIDRLEANADRFVSVSGNARRPVTTADGTISFFLTPKLTLVNLRYQFSNRLSVYTGYEYLQTYRIERIVVAPDLAFSISLLPWLSLDASYSHLHLDTAGGITFFAGSVGDGQSVATGSVNPTTDPAGAVFAAVQTCPLTFQSPMGRVAVKLMEKLRFDVGYHYYGYKEQFELYSVNESYRGNTGYTSLLWAF